MKMLLIHGVGYPEIYNSDWHKSWENAIQNISNSLGNNIIHEFDYVPYDDISQHAPLNILTYNIAVGELIKSEISHRLFVNKDNAMFDGLNSHVGIIAQWITELELTDQYNERIKDAILEFNPDIIIAHSFGSLISYQYLLTNTDFKGQFITVGSQIGNSFVVSNKWPNGIMVPLNVKKWYHIFNVNDPVFTSQIDLNDDRFSEVDIVFGNRFLDLSAHCVVQDQENGCLHTGYLDDFHILSEMWKDIFKI